MTFRGQMPPGSPRGPPGQPGTPRGPSGSPYPVRASPVPGMAVPFPVPGTPVGSVASPTGSAFSQPVVSIVETKMNTRIDLPPEAYISGPTDNRFPKRPSFNNSGKKIGLEVNQFRLSKIDSSKTIYQYDVAISGMNVKKPEIIVKKLWKHNQVVKALGAYNSMWLYDGRKLAWSTALLNRGELRMTVDLDEGKPNNKGTNRFLFMMRKTTEIKMHMLRSYLEGKIGWDNSISECMNFLDHAIRQAPSEHLIAIKRNFYNPMEPRVELGEFCEVAKGVYASICMNQNGGLGLGLNVDVANTAFWTGGISLVQLVRSYLAGTDRRWAGKSPNQLAEILQPEYRDGHCMMSEPFKALRRLHKIRFTCPHQNRGSGQPLKEHVLFRFLSGDQYGREGATARNVKITFDGKEMSLYEYFAKKYNITLKFASFPLVETTKKNTFIPIELCHVVPLQRYPFKLDPDQTARMIKYAVTRPAIRKKHILMGHASLHQDSDPYLKHFGIEFEKRFAKTQGVVLPNPEIQYGNSKKINPGTAGRWDLRGQKFLTPNAVELTSWGFVILERSVNLAQLEQFARHFKQIYSGHGGRIKSDPLLVDQSNNPNVADALFNAHQTIRKKHGLVQIIFCVLKYRNSNAYERLKKTGDCRLGILTQCIQGTHVLKNNAQYHSNVAMKVNAKLGGSTCRVPVSDSPSGSFFRIPTMVLGVDVSHASPGIEAASMASLTMSLDKDATRYAAAVETNGYRTEMLTTINVRSLMERLIPVWKKNISAAPQHIYYFRDGVSEGQFAQVLECEIQEFKRYFQSMGISPKFTVIVATKRHHVRFFPENGDKNGNPLPGTLLEREATHPFHWDFYLCSHVAIQGTARPVHYHVILDEAGVNPVDLQRMIYQQCYQYARSTTPVSLHPAVYYAHLASVRARVHENISSSEGPRSGPKAVELVNERGAKGLSTSSTPRELEPSCLLPIGHPRDSDPANAMFTRATMWYI